MYLKKVRIAVLVPGFFCIAFGVSFVAIAQTSSTVSDPWLAHLAAKNRAELLWGDPSVGKESFWLDTYERAQPGELHYVSSWRYWFYHRRGDISYSIVRAKYASLPTEKKADLRWFPLGRSTAGTWYMADLQTAKVQVVEGNTTNAEFWVMDNFRGEGLPPDRYFLTADCRTQNYSVDDGSMKRPKPDSMFEEIIRFMCT